MLRHVRIRTLRRENVCAGGGLEVRIRVRSLWAAEEPFCGAARAGGERRSALRWRYRRPGAFQSAARPPHELAEVA